MLPPAISNTFVGIGSEGGGGENVAEALATDEIEGGRARNRGRDRSGSTGESSSSDGGSGSGGDSDKEDERNFVLVDVNWLRQWVTGEMPDPHTPSRAQKSTSSKVSGWVMRCHNFLSVNDFQLLPSTLTSSDPFS